MNEPLLVTTHLSAPLAGDAPMLDSLLESALAVFYPKAARGRDEGFKIDRAGPCVGMGEIDIPLRRDTVGPWLVARCSSPILPKTVETVEHVTKKLAVEHAGVLREDERKIVTTTNAWTKSYRLPLRVRPVDRVCWFAFGDRREVVKALKRVGKIGKKVADGYGVVREWTVDQVDRDHSFYSPHPNGTLLMRPLPEGSWLPKDLIGFRREYRAVSTPYWHPARLTESVVPC